MTHKLFVLVQDEVGLLLLATTITDKHIARVLQTHVLVKCWQKIKSPVPDITRVDPIPLLVCALVLRQLLVEVKPKITSHAGKVVLVAHAALVQQFQEIPWEPVLCTAEDRDRDRVPLVMPGTGL